MNEGSTWSGAAVLVPAFVIGVSWPAGEALGHGSNDCTDPLGDFTSVIVGGPDCASPVGFCTLGELTGDIEGTYAFVMTSSTPAPTAEHPSREEFTGYSTITTAAGVWYGEDTGEIWFDGVPGFVTHVGVYDGEECYEDTHGFITAYGELDLFTGEAVGTYDGEICHAQDCFNRAPIVCTLR